MNAQTPVAAPSLDVSGAGSQLERSNILIVDDRLDKRVVFRTILEELDQNIVTASSGEEALRWLLDNESAVILLDVNMPGMDGLETAELIRARRKSSHTPIIFITAFADEMHTARGYSLGAVDYILSPVVPNVLRSKVKALVQLHRLNAELRKRVDERVALAKEQAARTAAEDAERRSTFLAEATHAMASSLDVDTILRSAAGLVVPFLADYGAVVLTSEDGSPRARRHAAVAGWDKYVGRHRQGFEDMLETQLRLALSGRTQISSERLVALEEAGDAPAGELHAFPLLTRGKSRGVMVVALGPSSRRLSAADLMLADSLAGRAASALENCLLYEEIQNADRRKNEFLATLSHELRNPLAPMRAALHMLRAGPVEESRSRGLLETMDRQVAQMSRLVEDLLDISRITRGAIELRREEVDVGAEVRNAVESCDGALRSGGHKLEVHLPAQPLLVDADRVRLQQILENLILNAAKYTPTGGRIDVAARAENQMAVIEVRDNGIGISADKLQQVWELFVQVDESTERTRKGLGIGLALVNDLVHRHGGTVEAASGGLGQGSTFTVRLPELQHGARSAGAPAPDAASRTQSDAGPGRRILVVDDNIDAAETLAMMLEILGQETRQAHDGLQAIEAARDYRPDVVFMDIGLPGLSGHEAAARMRQELGMTDTYLIALSGYGTEEDRRKSLQAGFDTHLVKPLDPSHLPELLASSRR